MVVTKKAPAAPKSAPAVEKPKSRPEPSAGARSGVDTAPPWVAALRFAMAPPPGPAEGRSPSEASASIYDAIVPDETTPRPGQLRRTEFMARIDELVKAAANEELAPIGRDAENCPYLRAGTDYYRVQPAARIERAIKLYTRAPPGDADALLDAVTARLRAGLIRWRETGELGAIPAESPLALPPEPVLRSSADDDGGGAAADVDPATVLARLGEGRPLDSAARGRMEGSFGTSFAPVRIHDDDSAARVASSIGAAAFAVREHIGFAPGAYRPGTPTGEAILAHELAHVRQQTGGGIARAGRSEEAALERDADSSAARALAGLHGRRAGSSGGVTGRGLMLQRCGADKVAPSGVTIDFTVTPEQEALMDLLEDLAPEYADYRAWQDAVKLQTTDQGLKLMGAAQPGDSEMGGASPPLDFPGTSFADLWEKQTRETLGKNLEAEGQPGDVYAFSQKVGRFASFFENYALNDGYQILAENEKLVQGEIDHYAGSPAAGGTADLQKALDPYRSRARSYRLMTTGAGGAITTKETLAEGVALAAEIRRNLQGRFPVLADQELDVVSVADATGSELQRRVLSTTNDRLSDIQKTRGSLKDKPSRVWQFDRALDRARKDLNIVEGSIFDQIIEDRLKQIAEDTLFRNLMIGALAIGLGAISMGEGTVAVLAAAGGAGLSIGGAAAHIQEYRMEEAAHGTAFDRATAISSRDPSFFWLALDVVFAVADLGMAFKAFRALEPAAAEFQAGKKTVDELKQAAKQVAKNELKLADKEADAVAEQIADGAKKHLQREHVIAEAEKVDKAGVTALRAALGDEASVSGILRIEAGSRVKLLAALEKKPEVLKRLGQLIDSAPQTAGTVEKMVTHMPDQFEAVISRYLLSRHPDAPAILRALADAGVTEEDFKAMAAALVKTKATEGIKKRFATMALERIADRLPSGAEGIKQLQAATKGLHPNQSGIIFQRWAPKNIYGRAAEGFYTDTKSVAERFKDAVPPPKFDGSKIILDDMRPIAPGKTAIVEYKHLRTSLTFDPAAKEELKDFATLLRVGAANKKGEVFSAVEYLFSSQEAALKNEKLIRDVLGQRVTIKYVDDAGKAVELITAVK